MSKLKAQDEPESRRRPWRPPSDETIIITVEAEPSDEPAVESQSTETEVTHSSRYNRLRLVPKVTKETQTEIHPTTKTQETQTDPLPNIHDFHTYPVNTGFGNDFFSQMERYHWTFPDDLLNFLLFNLPPNYHAALNVRAAERPQDAGLDRVLPLPFPDLGPALSQSSILNCAGLTSEMLAAHRARKDNASL